jgi:LPPG:FO 2-phospho-L-lactate transferase
MTTGATVLALAGGVGGAKLAHGLYRALPPNELAVVVNTGDDFDLYGLRICPDADTVLYTLAGIANAETGWGVAGETWSALGMLERYGEETWFRIGDRDLATHVLRTARLRGGQTLTTALADLAERLGVRASLLPMCDEPVPTRVQTPDGELAFQDYFVRRRQTDSVRGVRFQGIENARVTEQARAAAAAAEVIVLCPSNPIVSIGPILAVPGMRELLRGANVPVVAVSPIVGGRALKGPADRMLTGLGVESSAYGVAGLYRGLASAFVLDREDANQAPRVEELGMRVLVTDTVMRTVEDRERLAREVLAFARTLEVGHSA